jgi:hypothetical protein
MFLGPGRIVEKARRAEKNMRMRRGVLILFVLVLIGGGGQLRGVPAAAAAGATMSAATLSAASADVTWVRFEDPFEHAFALEVPQGWTAKGGLFRLGFSDQRPMVDLRSPDGKINIRLGDVSIPSYAVPNQFHQREGEIYDLGAQAQMVVAKYRSGPEFAVLYSRGRFQSLCRNPQADQADVDFSVPDNLPADMNATRSSSGQIAYRCETDQGPAVAFAYSKTALYGQLWQVPALVSFIAPPAQVALARSVIQHSVQSFQIEPQWKVYQQRMDAEGQQYQQARQQQRMAALAQQVQQFEAKMRAMQEQVNAFERRQNAQAAQVKGFTDVLNGITPTSDPLTGEHRDVWTGTKNGYWVNGQGQVVNSDTLPAAGWQQLQVPPSHRD